MFLYTVTCCRKGIVHVTGCGEGVLATWFGKEMLHECHMVNKRNVIM